MKKFHTSLQTRLRKASVPVIIAGLAAGMTLMPEMVAASTLNVDGGDGGTEFKPVYDFLIEAATGYLGRAIALIGGLIGLSTGALMGKALPAIMGVLLAAFAVLGPSIVDAIFASALI